MAPYDQIRAKYMAHWQPGIMTWEELVGWFLASPHGHVAKAPDFFVMGRAIIKAQAEHARDLTHVFEPAECDAWFLVAFAGDKLKAWRSLPHSLPWLAWQKFHDPDLELRFLETARIQSLCNLNG